LEEKTLELGEANQALQRDIAKRKIVERSLRESEERFRQLAENIQEVFWITDPSKSQMLYVSPTYERIWGRAAKDLIARPHEWMEAIHPEDRERVVQSALTNQTQGTYDETYRIVRLDGEVRWIHDRAFTVRNAAGEVYRLVGIAEDVTQRRVADEKMRELAALLSKAKDAILVRDLEHRILFWNPGAERLYGWTASEVAGKSVRELLYRDPSEFDKAMLATLANGDWSGELEQITRAGTGVTVESHWTLVRDDAGKAESILAINTDVTLKKKMEAQFLRSQRMESIGVLAGGIAHDLNNVLAPILMSLDVLKMKVEDEEGRFLISTLKTSVERGADLVRQVLQFARGAEGKRVPVKVGQVLQEVRNIACETFPKNIMVRFEMAQDLHPILGDPTQLHQVMVNLAVNARDAMPNGGRLTVTAKNTIVDEVYAAANADLKAGTYVEIDVTDSGTGIAPEARDRIFEPFFTTKEVGKGTGLGLSTTLSIVKSHGGVIHLYSEVGRGTTFRVYLPAHADAVAIASESESLPPLRRGNQELILVVDDDPTVRLAATMALERHGYRVRQAANGAEALAAYAELGANIAAVLTDMAMPIMDGPATIVALRAMDSKVRIIASSGLPDNHELTKSIDAFVPKPYLAELLVRTIGEVVSGERARP
jgi:PAS domain S-box-containing protein